MGYFLVDTGANVTIVASETAKSLGLGEKLATANMAGTAIGDILRVDSLTVGPLAIRGHPIVSMSLRPFERFGFDTPIVGVLGSDVLGEIPFTLDYRNKHLTLCDPRRFEPPAQAKESELAIINVQRGPGLASEKEAVGVPAVAALLNGRKIALQIDMGQSRGVIVAPSEAARHPDKIGRFPIHPTRDPVTLGPQDGRIHDFVIDDLMFLGTRWRNPLYGTTYVMPAGSEKNTTHSRFSSVGGTLLRHYRLTFNMRDRKLWASPAEMPEIPDSALEERNLAGLPRIIEALDFGDIELVRHLIGLGASLQFKDKSGYNVLHYAALGRSLQCLQALLAQEGCPKLSETTPGGLTPLHLAASLSEPELVQAMLAAGADVHAKTASGHTALHGAAEFGCLDSARMLLKAGAQPNVAAENDVRPIALAAMVGDDEMFRLLLDHGASLDWTSSYSRGGMSVLDFAAIGGNAKILPLVLARLPKGSLDELTNNGMTPLMCAASHGKVDFVRALLEAGADVHKQATSRPVFPTRGAIHYAAMQGRTEVIRLLLDSGVHPDCETSHGETPMMSAAGSGHISAIKLLLDFGADVNKGDRDNRRAIHWAALFGQTEVIQLLLDIGVHPDREMGNAQTPLMLAAQRGHVAAVKALLHSGADVNKSDDVSGWRAIHHAARFGQIEVIRLLLGSGVHPGQETGGGHTPLMLAAQHGHISAIEALLDSGADVHKIDKAKNTALHMATERGQAGVIPFLLRAGARPAATNTWNRRPLHIAADRGDADIARLLVEAGADPTAKGEHGRSAIEAAEQKGHRDLAAMLRRLSAKTTASRRPSTFARPKTQ
jgi:ankyrin repeat protein